MQDRRLQARRLQDSLAVITGASRGIGRAVALRFADEGARLVLVARTTGALEEIDDAIRKKGLPAPVLAPLDLRAPERDTEKNHIESLGRALFQRFGYIDILVGNAGSLGRLSPVSHLEPALWQEVFEINLLAQARLIRSLEPLLKASRQGGRALFVSSRLARRPTAFWSAYAASNAALESMVLCWAEEQKHSSLRINLLDPGAVRTALYSEAYPGHNLTTLPQPEDITDAFVQACAIGVKDHGRRLVIG